MIVELMVPYVSDSVMLVSTKDEARDLFTKDKIKPGRILLAEDVATMRKAGVTVEDARKLLDAKVTLDAPRILTTPSSAEK